MSPSWALKGPISFAAGTIKEDKATKETIDVSVVPHNDPYSRHALLNPATAAQLGILPEKQSFIELGDGSDCILPIELAESLPPNSLALTPTQQYNLHTKDGTRTAIRRFTPPSDQFSLVDVEVEVSIIGGDCDDDETDHSSVKLDAKWVAQQLLKAYLGLVVAVNEACVFPLPPELVEILDQDEEDSGGGGGAGEIQFVLRIRSCNTLNEDVAAETVGYHCFRGFITPQTTVYTTPASTSSGLSLQLENSRPRPPVGSSEHLISVLTNDGECFPVHRSLLRPCIALTKFVRMPGTNVEASIAVDTLTFDRVLIFLEAQALEKEPPSFGIHLIPPLKEAAEKLGLLSLKEWCDRRLGDSASRIRWQTFDEIRKRNSNGECILTMDGMVLDVTSWLPEHPGGSTIIPKQALNIDSSRFFELYHASRESFIYIREFYIGEVLPEDAEAVPKPETPPSEEFLRQLRQWTADFRLKKEDLSQRQFKSF